jgi:hypothetical protein
MTMQATPRERSDGGRSRQRPAHALRLLADQKGAAFFAVILLTALLLSLGIFGTRTGQIELAIAGNDLQAKRALQAAEAGLSHAFTLIRDRDANGLNGASDGFDDELSASGTGGALALLGSRITLNGRAYSFARFGGDASADGYYVRAADNYDETNGLNDPSADADFRIRLISRGRIDAAERVVEAVVERDHAFQCVLCGNGDFAAVPADVDLVGPIDTDSYNSDDGAYDPGTAGARGHIQSNGNIALNGAPSLPITVRGNVTARGSIAEGLEVDITGTTTELAAPVEYLPVAPCGPPFPPNDGITGGLYTQALGTVVNTDANEVIDLAPGDYCFSRIDMGGSSSLRVSGLTRIYLTEPSTIRGLVNTTNVAANLRIYSSVRSPDVATPPPGLEIIGGAQVAAAIYAPESVVTFTGISDFYGAAVGAVLPNVGIARLHYDEALERPGVRLIAWRELRNYVPD